MRAFLRSSATTLQTLESRKTLNECPGALEVAKTKHLCPAELELGLPLPVLSHGKWEHQQLGGASVILRVWLSAPLFQMHLESNDSSPAINWSPPSSHPPHSNQQGFVSVNPAKSRQKKESEMGRSQGAPVSPSNIINNMCDGAEGGQGKDASFTFMEVTLPFSALSREKLFFSFFIHAHRTHSRMHAPCKKPTKHFGHLQATQLLQSWIRLKKPDISNIPQQLVYVPAQTDEKEAWDILKNMYVDDG